MRSLLNGARRLLNTWRRSGTSPARRLVQAKLCLIQLEDRTVPTTFTVTSLADAGAGSLRAAIAGAHDGDVINFDPSLAYGTINLTSGQLEIAEDITIAAPARNWITIQRDGSASIPFFRIVQVDKGATVTLSGLVIAGGKLSFPVGSTTAYNISQGGGIYSGPDGSLTITDTLIANNRAGGLGVAGGPLTTAGGGIYSEGAVTIADSTLNGNYGCDTPLTMDQPWTGVTGCGGGIWNDGTLTIVASTITGNSIVATPYSGPSGGPHPMIEYSMGGALYTTPTAPLTMTRTVVSQNHVDNTVPYNGMDNRGGGLYLSAAAAITDSWINQNYAGGYYGIVSTTYGAGIYNNGGDLTITRTSITSNLTAGRDSEGGGIFNGNRSLPSGTAWGWVTITNSTISSNTAGWHAPAPISHTALGGGIANYGNLVITASTITKNVALGRALDGYVVAGGGIYHAALPGSNSATVRTTILAGNMSWHSPLPWLSDQPWTAPDAYSAPTYGAFVSDGYNLIGKTDGSTGWLVTDLKGTMAAPLDPKLGPLANNGGPLIGAFIDAPFPTRVVFTTHEVLTDSPALRAGNPTLSPFTDQRGVERDHARPNIGAYEATLAGFRVEPANIDPSDVPPFPVAVNSPFDLRVTAVDPYGKTVYVYDGTATFQSSDVGAILPANYTYTSSDDGSHVFSGVTFVHTGLQTITARDLIDPAKFGIGAFDVFSGGPPPPGGGGGGGPGGGIGDGDDF